MEKSRKPKNKVLIHAKLSLVLAFSSLLLTCFIVGPIPMILGLCASVLGHIALYKIRMQTDNNKGKVIAYSGVISGYIMFILNALIILPAFF